MKKLSLVFLVAGFVPALNAQKIYTLHPRTDLILMGAGLFAGVGGFVAGQNIEPLEPEDIAMLDRNNVFAIDRKSTYWLSDKADRASNFFFYGAPLAPALLLTGRKARRTAGTISVLYLETLTLTGGLTQLTKNLTLRARPYTYNPEFPFERKQKKVARQSFFSGHTSFSAASCFFTAKVWSDFHPGSRWKPVVWSTINKFVGWVEN